MPLGPARERLAERRKKLDSAVARAWEALRDLDLKKVAELSGARKVPGHELELGFLAARVRVAPESRRIYLVEGGRLSKRRKLLILHYLAGARKPLEEGRQVDFSELPGSDPFGRAFKAKIVGRIARALEHSPEALRARCEFLGGEPAAAGDFSARLRLFPNVATTITFWRGDSELPPRGSFAFDGSVTSYLSVEDVFAACEELSRDLTRGLPPEEP